MSQYLAPGVFVEEVTFQPNQIQPASTSIAGMVGPARFGQPGVPQLLTCFNDFQTYYGDAEDLLFQTGSTPSATSNFTNHCAYAAQVFFDNGGQQLYFSRIYNNVAGGPGGSPGPATASAPVPNTTGWLVNFQAQFPGTGGNLDLIFQPRRSQPLLQTQPSTSSNDVVLLTVVGSAANPLMNNLNGLSLPANVNSVQSITFVGSLTPGTPGTPAVPASGSTPAAPATPATPAVYTFTAGQPLLYVDQSGMTRVSPGSAPIAKSLNQSAVTAASVTLQTAQLQLPSTFDAGAMPVYSVPVGPNIRALFNPPTGVSTIYGTVGGTVSAAASGGTVIIGTFTAIGFNTGQALPASFMQGTPLAMLVMGGRAGDGGIYYDSYDISVLRNGTSIFAVPGVHLDAEAGSKLGNNLNLATAFAPPTADAVAPTQPIIATYSSPGTATGAALWPALLAAFQAGYLVPTTPGQVSSFVLQLGGGTDGSAPLPVDFSGEDAPTYGLAALESVEDISIVICPSAAADATNHQAVVAAMIAHCAKMLYRVAVIDSPKGASIAGVQTFRSLFSDTRTALYYPWISVASLGAAGGNITLPPSGFMAGLYANTDILRGVFKAPANIVVQDALSLETSVNTAQQEVLNPIGINCIRDFTWGGIRVWGARTLSSDPQWQYVNVRRYFLYLEKSLADSTSWVVFEPNGPALWSAVAATVTDFLYNEWREGHVFGATAAQAFFVRCDTTTMTQADIDDGRLICLIGAAPLEPAEFVIFRIGQYTASSNS